MTRDQELLYWQTLARERGRRLDVLQWRVLQFLQAKPQSTVATLARSLSGAGAPVVDADFLPDTAELQTADVVSVLEDLWVRAANR